MFPIFFLLLLQAATKKRASRKEIFKRAEQYVKEYRNQVCFISSSQINQRRPQFFRRPPSFNSPFPLPCHNRNSTPSDSAVQPSPKTASLSSQRPSSSLSSVFAVSMTSPQRPRRSCNSSVSAVSTVESSSRSTRPP